MKDYDFIRERNEAYKQNLKKDSTETLIKEADRFYQQKIEDRDWRWEILIEELLHRNYKMIRLLRALEKAEQDFSAEHRK